MILPCFLVSSPGAYGGVYKWVDAEGKVHYGSKKPADASAERLNIDTTPSPAKTPDKTADKTDTKDAKDAKDKTKDGKKEEKPAEPKKDEPPKISKKEKRRLCKQARQNKASIESHGRIRETDEKGNTVYLTDKTKKKRLVQANKLIKKHCR